jgi:hypothetical protein
MSLERVRKILFTFPEMVESESFGQPWFRAGGKMITVYEKRAGGWAMCFKCGKKDMGIFLEDARFTKAPYIGNHGWVMLTFEGKAKPNWEEITELLKMSYRNNAPPKLRGLV